jgi:ABC-type uncharacterized transport system fused permease/ATPase subunit
MGPVVRYVIKQEKYEGDFRFIHMLVRLNSESIAFHGGGQTELEKTNDSAGRLISTQYRLYLKQYFLNISINLFDYFGSIVSYLVLAIPIFSGVYDGESPADLSSIISQVKISSTSHLRLIPDCNVFVMFVFVLEFIRDYVSHFPIHQSSGYLHPVC